MGRRGPAPTPTAIKKARGETRPSRIGKKEIAPKAVAHLEAPEDLSDDAKPIWIAVVDAIGHTGVITAVDVEALRAYAESVATYRKAANIVARGGPIIKGRNGELVRNPAIIVMKQAGEASRAWARELGLTPASRVGLEAVASQGQHAGANAKLDAILAGADIAAQLREGKAH
jgi:P27 family predicted phage terminase small subunit